jgi:hypothetical protein
LKKRNRKLGMDVVRRKSGKRGSVFDVGRKSKGITKSKVEGLGNGDEPGWKFASVGFGRIRGCGVKDSGFG